MLHTCIFIQKIELMGWHVYCREGSVYNMDPIPAEFNAFYDECLDLSFESWPHRNSCTLQQ